MKLYLYTAPLRSRYGAESITDAIEVPDGEAGELLEMGIAQPADTEDVEPEEPEEPEPQEETEAVDYAAMTKAELVRVAEERDIEVVRQDGEDGVPLKDDYIAALEAAGD